MRFTSIYLLNYIGIYNGMGLNEIHIDMTRCRNRITIIKGDNGSGKSTLSKAMSVFPDPNESFIPGLPAKKEIVLLDGNTIYRLLFIHGIKSNGTRDTTKAYITKTFNGQSIELNENGNVSSYKDILYDELKLDSNFVALSQLSNDNRGLADMKPAERKRFVNSIISSLETYNGIYKTLSKRSSNLKSMTNAIVAKLSVIGDQTLLTASLESLEERINSIQDSKDSAVADLAREQSMISILDPDGSIQLSSNSYLSELKELEKERAKISGIIDSLVQSNGIVLSDYQQGRQATTNRKNSLIIDNQIDRNSIDSLIREKESEATDLNARIQRLAKLQDECSYDDLVSRLDEYEQQADSIRMKFASAGITNIGSISKEEYILALESLKDLLEYIKVFESCSDYSIIEKITSEYLISHQTPSRHNIEAYSSQVQSLSMEIEDIKREISVLSSRISILDSLSIRPKSCNDDSCPFIKDAVILMKSNPTERLDYLNIRLQQLQDELDRVNSILAAENLYNDTVNKFSIIIREVIRNASILAKIDPLFSDTDQFFQRLIAGYSFDYMSVLYTHIDMANLLDVYNSILRAISECKSNIKIYESKSETIDSLHEEIARINASISSIIDRIDPIKDRVAKREQTIIHLQELEGVYDTIISNSEKLKSVNDRISELNEKLKNNEQKRQSIQLSLSKIEGLKARIVSMSKELAPLMKDRDSLVHKIRVWEDYTKEKDELQRNYEFIETLKYYSSPTTGIQLVFMELYMGKIIALANKLLSLLFGGQFVIQPFIINESEFRIPCLGSGYLNDDISSMSSSQIGMISMILSFSLLYHSSTKYNIIKLDEIDGPLDYNNRTYFMDVLNSIMDIMQTEQCIMISHNSELQVDNCDVILLRHDIDNGDYRRGNIIWSL